MKKQSGFTFIEIALVLAIAGLIFLMAFIALPSLWASQRDADRKARVMEFVSDAKTYQTNNSRGALPVLVGDGPEYFEFPDVRNLEKTPAEETTTWKAMVRDYVDANFVEPSGNEYKFYIVKCAGVGGASIDTGKVCEYGPVRESSNFNEINNPSNLNFENGIDHTIYVAVGATCDGDHAVRTNSNRSIAAVQVLERGSRHCYNT